MSLLSLLSLSTFTHFSVRPDTEKPPNEPSTSYWSRLGTGRSCDSNQSFTALAASVSEAKLRDNLCLVVVPMPRLMLANHRLRRTCLNTPMYSDVSLLTGLR